MRWNRTLPITDKYKTLIINEKVLKNPQKFKNSNKIGIARSSYEIAFIKWLDITLEVEWWYMESLKIPYIHPYTKQIKNYFPDFLIKIENKIYVIEIKPSKKLIPPEKRKYKQYKEFLINLTKFKYAKIFCEKKGFEFKLITEKTLF